jgi:hypothetical protein
MMIALHPDREATAETRAAFVRFLDDFEPALNDAGFAVPLQLDTSLVCAAPLLENDPTGAESRAIVARAVALGREAAERLRSLAASHPISVRVHVDVASLRAAGDRSVVIGGPLLRVGMWPRTDPGDGVEVTAAARLLLGR